MLDLTDRQREILQFIIDFKADREYSPSVREIGKAFIISVRAAADHIKALEKKGYIEKEPGISRGIKIIKAV